MENRHSVHKTAGRFVTAALMLMLTFVLSVTGVHADACTSQALVNTTQDTVRIQAAHVEDQGVTRDVVTQVYYGADGMGKMTAFPMIYDQTQKVWTVDIKLTSLQTQKTGQYFYMVQGTNASGAPVQLSNGSFTITKSALAVKGTGANGTKATFNAVVTGLEKSTDVASVTVTATSKSNVSYTYAATRQSNGTYVAVVDANKHNFYRGKYTLSATVILNNGLTGTVNGSYTFNPKNLFHMKDYSTKKKTFYFYNPF